MLPDEIRTLYRKHLAEEKEKQKALKNSLKAEREERSLRKDSRLERVLDFIVPTPVERALVKGGEVRSEADKVRISYRKHLEEEKERQRAKKASLGEQCSEGLLSKWERLY